MEALNAVARERLLPSLNIVTGGWLLRRCWVGVERGEERERVKEKTRRMTMVRDTKLSAAHEVVESGCSPLVARKKLHRPPGFAGLGLEKWGGKKYSPPLSCRPAAGSWAAGLSGTWVRLA